MMGPIRQALWLVLLARVAHRPIRQCLPGPATRAPMSPSPAFWGRRTKQRDLRKEERERERELIKRSYPPEPHKGEVIC